MCHHLNLSGFCRPENGRKSSLVFDVEVCTLLDQDLSCVSLGCSRLLHIWGTPHQCFLHQLYNIYVLQVCSKHWTSAHKQGRYNEKHAKTATTTLKKNATVIFSTLFRPRYVAIPCRVKYRCLWPRVKVVHLAPFLQKKLTPRCEGEAKGTNKSTCFLWIQDDSPS